MLRLKLGNSNGSTHLVALVFTVAAVAVTGTYLLVASHADSITSITSAASAAKPRRPVPINNPIKGSDCNCTIKPTGITLHWWDGQYGRGIQPLINIFNSNGLSVQVAVTSGGQVYQMTKHLNSQANHAIGGNTTTIGVEIEGKPSDFGKAGIQKYPKKFIATVATVKYLMKKYNIPLYGAAKCDAVVGVHSHKEYNGCPGAVHKIDIDDYYFNAVINSVRG